MNLKFNNRVAGSPMVASKTAALLSNTQKIMNRAELAVAAQGEINYQEELQALTIQIANGEGTTQKAVLFDAFGISGETAGTTTNTNPGGVDYADVVSISAFSNLLCIGFQYQADSPSQFAQTCEFINTNLDGSRNKKPLSQMITLDKSPEYLNETLLKVYNVRPFIIDWSFALAINVLASSTVQLTFQFAKQYRLS